VIAGEMLELGNEEKQLHYEAGRDIAEAGVELLWGVRGLAAELVKGAAEAGVPETRFFSDSKDAAAAILKEVREGDLILVKGSRGVATDRIVKELRQNYPLAGEDEAV
jgi:UDP-N-acetylmuramoyl-tripeptide--D-alanyl-D-alanine ligase